MCALPFVHLPSRSYSRLRTVERHIGWNSIHVQMNGNASPGMCFRMCPRLFYAVKMYTFRASLIGYNNTRLRERISKEFQVSWGTNRTVV